MDDDMMAMMGFGGFGKQTKQKKLDPSRFDKNKRVEVMCNCNIVYAWPLLTYAVF